MSYDLVAFDPDDAPRARANFKTWYMRQSDWNEGQDYNDPAATTASLRFWYEDIRKTYPNLNGPDAVDDAHVDDSADYSIGHHMIYATFRWSKAEEIYPLFRALAVKHSVGFYDVSGDEGNGEIHFPGDVLRPPSEGQWRSISKQFRELEGKK